MAGWADMLLLSRPFSLILAIFAALLATGCSHFNQKDACGLRALKKYVGQTYTGEISAEINRLVYGASEIEAIRWDQPQLRILRPGEDIIANHVPWRLNLSLDAQDRILGMACF